MSHNLSGRYVNAERAQSAIRDADNFTPHREFCIMADYATTSVLRGEGSPRRRDPLHVLSPPSINPQKISRPKGVPLCCPGQHVARP